MSTKYRKRAWLNKDRSKRAYVIAHVDGINTWESCDTKYTDMGGTLELGDCRKTIWLDFAISDPKEKANVLSKVKILREIVNNFLDTVEAEASKSDFKPVKLPKKEDGKTKRTRKKTALTLDPDGEIAVLASDLIGGRSRAVCDSLL